MDLYCDFSLHVVFKEKSSISYWLNIGAQYMNYLNQLWAPKCWLYDILFKMVFLYVSAFEKQVQKLFIYQVT